MSNKDTHSPEIPDSERVKQQMIEVATEYADTIRQMVIRDDSTTFDGWVSARYAPIWIERRGCEVAIKHAVSIRFWHGSRSYFDWSVRYTVEACVPHLFSRICAQLAHLDDEKLSEDALKDAIRPVVNEEIRKLRKDP